MKRKKLSDSLAAAKLQNVKDDSITDKIIDRLEGNYSEEKKMTVVIPEYLHQKIKMAAIERKTTVRELIIEMIQNM